AQHPDRVAPRNESRPGSDDCLGRGAGGFRGGDIPPWPPGEPALMLCQRDDGMADDPQPVRSVAETATSRSLLMLLKDGQPAAWERLVSLSAPLVYHWCRGMRVAEQDMPDVFQQVFQSVASHIQGFHKDRPGDTFRHWLRAITRNKVRDHFRRDARQAQAAGGTDAQIYFSQLAAPPTEPEGADEAVAHDEEGDIRQLLPGALAAI